MIESKRDQSTQRQAAQILAAAQATKELIERNERLIRPRRAPKTATEIQAAQMLRGTREWNHEDDLVDWIEGQIPEPPDQARD